jgi:hypothetical protein
MVVDETERRTGEQGGAYVGGVWYSADDLRSAGRRVTDAIGGLNIGVCPMCDKRRLGATEPGGSVFRVGLKCPHCGHVAMESG